MSHLASEHLYAAVFDQIPLPVEAAEHMAQCADCRRAHAELAALAHELAVQRAAAAPGAAIDRYAALFAHVQQNPTPLRALWRSFTALLTWDSRQQPALQGVRSVAAAGYRLLYASAEAEIELLVEGDGHLFRVHGEIVAPEEHPLAPALVQWLTPAGELRYETQSDAGGQFALRGVDPGLYRLAIVTAPGDSIFVEALEIA